MVSSGCACEGVFRQGLSFSGKTFIHGGEYRLFISFQNLAGAVSEWVGSLTVKADFLPPLPAVSCVMPVETASGEARYILNEPAEWLLTMKENGSEAVYAEIEVYNSSTIVSPGKIYSIIMKPFPWLWRLIFLKRSGGSIKLI